MTHIERLMHRALESSDAHRWLILEQHPIHQYVADFIVIHLPTSTKLVVECDGHAFHDRTPEQAERDRRRDRYILATLGLPTIRFTGREIVRDVKECVNGVAAVMQRRCG